MVNDRDVSGSGGSAHEKILSRKDRIRINIRRFQQKNIPAVRLLIISAVLFALIIAVPKFQSHSAVTTYEDREGADPVAVMDFTGDMMLGRCIAQKCRHTGYDGLFDGVRVYWSNADLVFANLESAVLFDDLSAYENADESVHLSAVPEAADAAVRAGVNVFACANDHSFDYGGKAAAELVDHFRSNDIDYAGIETGITSFSDEMGYKILPVNGLRISVISITDIFDKKMIHGDYDSSLLTTGHDGFESIISEAAANSDITVVYIHWGAEDDTEANDEQRLYAHQLIDSGADIIIGTHPHVLQGTEQYKDGIIFYSLGNFIHDQGETYQKDSVMAEFSYDGKNPAQFELIPLRINEGVPQETGNGFFKARINEALSEGLDPDLYSIDEDGHIIISADFMNISTDHVYREERMQ